MAATIEAKWIIAHPAAIPVMAELPALKQLKGASSASLKAIARSANHPAIARGSKYLGLLCMTLTTQRLWYKKRSVTSSVKFAWCKKVDVRSPSAWRRFAVEKAPNPWNNNAGVTTKTSHDSCHSFRNKHFFVLNLLVKNLFHETPVTILAGMDRDYAHSKAYILCYEINPEKSDQKQDSKWTNILNY